MIAQIRDELANLRNEADALRARAAELEACIAEVQAQKPICYKVFIDDGDYVYIDDGVPIGYPAPNIIPLGPYPLPAPVAAVPDGLIRVGFRVRYILGDGWKSEWQLSEKDPYKKGGNHGQAEVEPVFVLATKAKEQPE